MAYTGMSLLWGYPDSPPDARVKVAQPDYISAATQALAVIAALPGRIQHPVGQLSAANEEVFRGLLGLSK